MDTNILSYAAGLFDGEGTVTLTRASNGQYRFRYPVVSISSTTPELLTFMKEHFNGHIINLTNTNIKHKKAQHWQVSRNPAIECLQLIVPYIREPSKLRRAHLILDYYKQVTPANGKYTDYMLINKRLFEEAFFNEDIAFEMVAGGGFEPTDLRVMNPTS